MNASRNLLRIFAAAVAILWTSESQAARWAIFYRLCPFEIIEIPELILDKPIPVGCEVVDCCPGCPGPGPLEWRIRFDGGPFNEVALEFENLAPETVKALRVAGNAKLDGARVLISQGEAVLSGLSADIKGRAPVAVPRLGVSEAFRARAAQLEQDDRDRAPETFEFTIEQVVDEVVVNSYVFRYVLWPCVPPVLQTDTIDLDQNTANDNAVVIMDARRSAGCRDDEIVRVTSLTGVGSVLSNGTCISEVAVFSDDNAMALRTPVTSWSNALGDRHTETLDPILQVPVSIWVTRAGGTVAAANDIANANLIYNDNNVGVQFDATITDLSGNTTAVNTIGTGCSDASNAQASTWYTANTLNAYYVDSAFTGVNCGFDRNINYIGTTANLATLPHEIAHAYGLRPSASWGHTNDLPDFGNDNLMWGGGPGTRDQITVGQAFRINVHTGSMLNVNGDRVGTTRTCAPNVTSALCPALSLDAVPH